jgi:hypothetical protein
MRGLRGEGDPFWIVAGSVAAAGAALVRQPGLLLPIAAVAVIFLDRRAVWRQPRALMLVEAVAVPLVAFAVYYAWLRFENGVPVTQELVQDEVFGGGWAELQVQAGQLAYIETIYAGMFVLPLAAAAAFALPRVVRGMRGWGWLMFAPWAAIVLFGLALSWTDGMRMPYIPHFLSPRGLGPNDLIDPRRVIIGSEFRDAFTIACVLGALIGGLVVAHGLARGAGERRGVLLVAAVLLLQAAAVVPTSSHFRFWQIEGHIAPSLDRYLLPLLPLLIALVLWALRDLRVYLIAGWLVAIVLGVFAVAGTRDNLVFHERTWELAQIAEDAGVPELHLDGGASWDGYHLGEYSLAERGYNPTPALVWWLSDFAPVIDAQYLISARPVPGYTPIMELKYDLWLDTKQAQLLLQRRNDVPGPP